MNRAILILFPLILLSSMNGLAQKGYMGKKNELGIDLFNTVYQGVYELEYKRSMNKHLGLLFSAGFYASKKEYGMDVPQLENDFDPASSLTTGPTFGVGLGYNRERLGMAYPIGYCMSYGYKVSFLKIEDAYDDRAEPLRFDQTVHQLFMRMSRNYNLFEQVDLQLSVRTGMLLSRVQHEEAVGISENEETIRPLRVLPAKHPFSTSGTYQLQEFPLSSYRFRFFLMPMVRLSYLF